MTTRGCSMAAWPLRLRSGLLQPLVLALLLPAKSVQAMFWLLGKYGQSCAEACPTLCMEDAKFYPQSIAEFQGVVAVLNTSCKEVSSGGMRYDPSVDGGFCGFRRTDTAPPGTKFCNGSPPPSARRFCPCSGTTVRGDLRLNFKVHCPEESETLHKRAKIQCDTSGGHDGMDTWSAERRTLCCCVTGQGCLPSGTMVKAAATMEVGLALEKTFADGVGVRRDHLGLVPPPREVEMEGYGTQGVRWAFNLVAESEAELKGLDCHLVRQATSVIDWTGPFRAAADSEVVPLPYDVEVGELGCRDRLCDAWQWGEEGEQRPLSAERQAWCCEVRGESCGPSHAWLLVVLVGALNVVALIGVLVCHWGSCSPANGSDYKPLSLPQSDTER